MNDKLLRAFIEAQGYEIEKLIDTKETPISRQSGEVRASVSRHTGITSDLAVNSDGSYKRGDDECYYLEPSLSVDYKVTKKDDLAVSIITRLLLEFETDCNGPSCEVIEEAEKYINESPN